MKNLIISMTILFACSAAAQEFNIEKVIGKVHILKSSGETWTEVKPGQNFQGGDMIQTGEGSSVLINRNGSRFLLRSNSALGLNYLRKMTLNELLLALAAEEIKSIPDKNNNDRVKNTAVYGKNISKDGMLRITINEIGLKRLNGAKQLSENGFKESAVLAAKETYRKYPDTQYLSEERLFFADLITELKLYDEAYSELQTIQILSTDEQTKKQAATRMDNLKKLMMTQ